MTRVRAPELRGRGWLNTGGKSYTIKDFRGKIVLLDFWTFCCINCLHVLDELRPLEEKYGDVLVVVGVHSPKFEHERDPDALAAAVERYGVDHPVLDDPTLLTWDQYAARAWPTLAVVDPLGYVVATMAGEGHAAGLATLIDELIAVHQERGTLHRGDGPYVAPEPADTLLRFPGKAVPFGGGYLVSDSARHRIVRLAADFSVMAAWGSGDRGHVDGPGAIAQFNEPQGICVLPPDSADHAGFDVVIADTVNHLLRGLNTGTGEVTTIAGTGRQWRGTVDLHAHDATSVDLSSPWDLAWYDGKVIIAMAGIHQLWWYDPTARTAGVYAGTTVEALRDGPLDQAWMAQPSGLSVGGDRLWIADSESSALRWISGGELHTAVGQGLFDFGLMDGPAAQALLQHPLGVCALPDGSVLVADTYNGAVRRFDPATDMVTTVATGLAEPSDLVLAPEGGVIVVESAAHQLVRLAPGALTSAGVRPDGSRQRTERPVTALATGEVTLEVIFSAPPGQKLDEQFGPSTRLEVSASPASLLISGAGVTSELRRTLTLAPGTGVLQVVAQAATCDIDDPHGACHLTRQDWGVPISVATDGSARLPLVLRGMDEAK